MRINLDTINSADDFHYIYKISYKLWPTEAQQDFLVNIANSVSRTDAITVHKILFSHLRWFQHPTVLSSTYSNASMKTHPLSLFSSCNELRETVTLKQYQALANFIQDQPERFNILIHHVIPTLLADNRYDLLKLLNDQLQTHQSTTAYHCLPEKILRNIIKHINSRHELLAFAQTCQSWRSFAGRHEQWTRLMIKATSNLPSLKRQVKIWKQSELCVDPQPLRYYKLVKMLETNAATIIQAEKTKMDKKRELRKLNLVHLKQQQKERRLKKVENEQRSLHENLMEELMEELKTNPKWKAHLMKVYREMYNTGRERYEQRKSSYAFYRISRLTKTMDKSRMKFTPSVCKITEGAGLRKSELKKPSELSKRIAAYQSKSTPRCKKIPSMSAFEYSDIEEETEVFAEPTIPSEETEEQPLKTLTSKRSLITMSSSHEVHSTVPSQLTFDRLDDEIELIEYENPDARKSVANLDMSMSMNTTKQSGSGERDGQENTRPYKLDVDIPVMYVACFQLPCASYLRLIDHLFEWVDWESVEVQYSPEYINKTWNQTLTTPTLRGSQLVKCMSSRFKPMQVIPVGNKKFGIACRDGTIQLVWAGRRPSLHLEVISRINTGRTMITTMHHVGGRFNLIITGNWGMDVQGFSCSSTDHLFSIVDHNDTIVSIDHAILSPTTLLILTASKNGRVTIHKVVFKTPSVQKAKFFSKVQSITLIQSIHYKHIRKSLLIDHSHFVVLFNTGETLVYEIDKKEDLLPKKLGKLQTTCYLPVLDIVKRCCNENKSKRLYAVNASGLLYTFTYPEIKNAPFTSSTSFRITRSSTSILFPSSSSQCSLTIIDKSLPTIFTQVIDPLTFEGNLELLNGGKKSEDERSAIVECLSKATRVGSAGSSSAGQTSHSSDQSVLFPVCRSLIGHQNNIRSVATTNSTIVSIDEEGDIKVWFSP